MEVVGQMRATVGTLVNFHPGHLPFLESVPFRCCVHAVTGVSAAQSDS